MISLPVVMTVYLFLSAFHVRTDRPGSYSLMICGCLNSCRYCISLSTLPAMSRDISFFREMIFSATSWPLTRWTASLTLPKDPSPRVFKMVYCPTRCSCLLAEDALLSGRCGAILLGGGSLEGRRSLTPERDIESSSSSKVEAMLAF